MKIDSSTTAEELKQGDLVGIKFDNGANHTVDVSAVKNTTVGIDLGAGDDTITTANDGITVVSAGAGYDTINLGDGIDAVVLKDLTSPSDDGKVDTINGFKGGEGLTTDLLVFKAEDGESITLDGANISLTGDGDSDGLYTMIATKDNTKDDTKDDTIDLNTYSAVIVTEDVESFDDNNDNVAEVITDLVSNSDDKTSIFIIDDGTDARVYLYQADSSADGDDNSVTGDELTQIAELTGVNTEDLFVDDILV